MSKKITVSMLLIAALSAAGCKKKDGDGKSGGEPAVAASQECKDAAEHVQELMLRMTPADAPDETKAKTFGESRDMADRVAAGCTKDKWTAEGISCVKTTEKLADCAGKLTPEQQKVLPKTVP